MTHVSTIIIGGGQAGLAMSRCLSDRAIDHVVLERGRIAERWRSERWDSLRLLTPNWLSRLPGFRYDGPDPDGYMTMPEVVDFFERYARCARVPVEPATTVLRVEPAPEGFRVATDRGDWSARAVVMATGYSDVPVVPSLASRLPSSIQQLVPTAYRNPGDLPEGGVLVVGASASGIQLADELHRSGRPVTIAAGHHTRVPRVYRGRDIMWWLDRTGLLDETEDQVYDVGISREQPSLQLIGHPDRHSLDLRELQARGVRVTGRLVSVDSGVLTFADDLVATTAASDVKLGSLLARIDECAGDLGQDIEDAEPFEPAWPAFTDAPTTLSLREAGITSVLWATGFGRRYPWLRVPALDERGEIRHHGGVTTYPGLYAIGLHFQRKRKSSFIDGVGEDAAVLSEHIAAHLARPGASRAAGLVTSAAACVAMTFAALA